MSSCILRREAPPSYFSCECEFFFFFASRRRHTRCSRDWSSDVCSSDLVFSGRRLRRESRASEQKQCDGQQGEECSRHTGHSLGWPLGGQARCEGICG